MSCSKHVQDSLMQGLDSVQNCGNTIYWRLLQEVNEVTHVAMVTHAIHCFFVDDLDK